MNSFSTTPTRKVASTQLPPGSDCRFRLTDHVVVASTGTRAPTRRLRSTTNQTREEQGGQQSQLVPPPREFAKKTTRRRPLPAMNHVHRATVRQVPFDIPEVWRRCHRFAFLRFFEPHGHLPGQPTRVLTRLIGPVFAVDCDRFGQIVHLPVLGQSEHQIKIADDVVPRVAGVVKRFECRPSHHESHQPYRIAME